jgi:hypothetical protein
MLLFLSSQFHPGAPLKCLEQPYTEVPIAVDWDGDGKLTGFNQYVMATVYAV